MKANKDYYAPMHTAEHILNQTMIRMFNCKRSFSNHIERKKSKCDYKFHKNLNDEEIMEINRIVNEVIQQNHLVTEKLIAYKDAKESYELDKIPGEQPESIRIVKVGDYDACPCIGAHVKNTSEIGEFRITTTSFENAVLRVRYKLKNTN